MILNGISDNYPSESVCIDDRKDSVSDFVNVYTENINRSNTQLPMTT